MRSAVALQIGRRRAQVHDPRCQAGSEHARVLQATEADGQVEAAVQQIEGLVAQFDLYSQLRMALHEVIHQRHDEALTVSYRAGHAQQALGFAGEVADRAQGFLAGILQALAVLQKSLPSLGQRDLARAAVEQAGLQAFFQSGHLAADLRRRQTQALGRSAELATLGDRNEFIQAFPAVHMSRLSLVGNNVLLGGGLSSKTH